MIVRTIRLILILLLAPIHVFAVTRYVSKTNSNDGNACTQAAPCLTIARGMATIAGGDTLVIGDGTYLECIQSFPAGSAGAPTIIRAANRNLAIVRPNGTCSPLLYFNASYITVDGIDADCGGKGSNLCTPYENNPGTVVNNITLQHGTARNSGNGTSGNNEQSGIDFSFTYASPEDRNNIRIWDMDVVNNGGPQTGSEQFEHGIYLGGGANSIIEGNRIHGSRGWGIQIYDHGTPTNHIIRNNTIYSNANRAGIMIASGATGTLIYNNVIYSNGTHGIETYSNAIGTLIYNNTIYGNTNYCVLIATGATGSTIRNNICYSNTSGAISDSGTASSCTYNLGVTGGEGASNSCSATSTATNPSFVNAAGANFHLSSAMSPAVGAATPLTGTFTTDFDNVVRGVTWDQGAYEFVTGGAPFPSKTIFRSLVVR